MIEHIMACLCGHHEVVEPEVQQLGSVYKCPACNVVTAAVYPQSGGKVWITVDPKEVKFYNLINEVAENEE